MASNFLVAATQWTGAAAGRLADDSADSTAWQLAAECALVAAVWYPLFRQWRRGRGGRTPERPRPSPNRI